MNQRHTDFQSVALPAELPAQVTAVETVSVPYTGVVASDFGRAIYIFARPSATHVKATIRPRTALQQDGLQEPRALEISRLSEWGARKR